MSTPDANTPADDTGDGPVTLEDRVQPGGEGSPGSNQSKTEPMSPTGTHAEPMAPPDLDEMNVGANDPQAPRHPAALRSETSATGAYAHEPVGEQVSSDPGGDTTDTTGTAHRAPGLQGATPEGESVDTDVAAGAARMGPQALDSTEGEAPGQGDDAGVPSSGTAPLEGASEEHRIVAGVRLPDESE